MLKDQPTKSQFVADMVNNHPAYKILIDEIFGGIISSAEALIWDSKSPEERAARVEGVAHWKILMKTVNAKISNTLKDAQQQQKEGTADVQETKRTGRRS